MVLADRPSNQGNQGIRFIIGVSIIALSIYGFYIALTKQNSPELFLIPVAADPPDGPCTEVVFPGLCLCVPPGFSVRPGLMGDRDTLARREGPGRGQGPGQAPPGG